VTFFVDVALEIDDLCAITGMRNVSRDTHSVPTPIHYWQSQVERSPQSHDVALLEVGSAEMLEEISWVDIFLVGSA
jgi:hypothetical protein